MTVDLQSWRQLVKVELLFAVTMNMLGAVELGGCDMMKSVQSDLLWGMFWPWRPAATANETAIMKSMIPRKNKKGPEAANVGSHIAKFQAKAKIPCDSLGQEVKTVVRRSKTYHARAELPCWQKIRIIGSMTKYGVFLEGFPVGEISEADNS